jgi:HlyD family secretion protein
VAQRGDVTQTVAASGTLSAITTVEIGSQVSGQIAKLHVDFNAVVQADQLVAEIEPSTYESRVLQADADLASARSNLELKALSARRAEELLQKKLLSQADHDQSMTELRQQQSTVRVKEAALKSAQVDLERTKIRAPIDGVVISRDVNLGQTVQASFSSPKLFILAKDLREMQITASVSEADIGGVDPGQSATFTVDAFPGRTFTGQVREVRNNPTTINNVVNYATIIDVRNPDLKLRPGMTANVTITIARRSGVLRLPNSALRFRPPEGVAVANATAAGAQPTGAAGANDEGPNLDQMPPEVRERILANFDKNKDGQLDAEERKAMREQFRARTAGGGGMGGGPGGGMGGAMMGGRGGGMFGGGGMGGGGFAGAGAPSQVRPQPAGMSQTKTVYLVAGKPDSAGRATGTVTATVVRTGLADGGYTEILSGLEEGAVVATGTSTTAPAPSGTTSTNPFLPRPPTPKSR